MSSVLCRVDWLRALEIWLVSAYFGAPSGYFCSQSENKAVQEVSIQSIEDGIRHQTILRIGGTSPRDVAFEMRLSEHKSIHLNLKGPTHGLTIARQHQPLKNSMPFVTGRPVFPCINSICPDRTNLPLWYLRRF